MNSHSITDFSGGPSKWGDFNHWFQVHIYNIEEWDSWAQGLHSDLSREKEREKEVWIYMYIVTD